MTELSPSRYQVFLSDNPFFRVLSEEEVSLLARQLVVNRYQFGQTIINQGSHCKGLYVVFSGSVRLFVQENGKEISMGLRKSGDIFADVNVLRNSRMEYTARATAECEILIIPRASLTDLWEKNRKIEEYMARYAAVKTTGGLVARLFDLQGESGNKDFESMIETIGIKRVDSGKVILRQDTFDDRRLYIVRQGRVRVVRQEGDKEFLIEVLGKGETFGERALLLSDNQPATVIAETASTFLVIPASTVKTILDNHPTLRTGFEDRITSFEQELERQQRIAGRHVGRWHFSPVGEAEVGEKILDRFPLVEQEEEMDCGGACLAMICRYYGIQTTLEHLRDFADIDIRGATLESLAVASERLGFIARGVSVTFTDLIDLELPLVAHWQGYHFIVVYGISRHRAYIADPAAGFKKMTLTEFEKGWDGTCLVLDRDKRQIAAVDVDRPKLAHSNFFRLAGPLLLPLMATTAMSGLVIVVSAFLMINLLDGVVLVSDSPSPGLLALAFLCVSGLGCLAVLLRNLLSGHLKYSIARNATSQFIQQILYQPLEFFERRTISDLMARFRDGDKLWTFVAEPGVEMLVAFWTLVFSWLTLFYFDASLALSYIGIHLFVLVILWYSASHNRGVAVANPVEASVSLKDILQGIETIKAQGAEYWMRCRWESLTAGQNELRRKNFRRSSFLNFGIRLIQFVALTVFVWKGSILYLQHHLTAGEFVAALLLAAVTIKPVGDLANGWLEWLTIQPSLQRVQSISRLAPEQSSEQTAENIILPDLKGRMCIESLYFRYQKHSAYVIEGLDCEIESQQWVNIIGPSGSGKTTLAKLLMGFYSVREGRIDVDGYPLNLLEKGSYRRQIGFLPQSPLLIAGTLADNIALGIRAPQRKRIVDLCHLVGLNDWISQLPAGYDHPVTEHDELTSSDLIQRLGVARALVRSPSVLIFDQALSTLDRKAESDILNGIRKTYPNITMITLSDRVNPSLQLDSVFMLYNGRITENGSPADLSNLNGLYSQLLTALDSSL